MKKEKFEIRQIDAYMDDGEWIENTSYNYGVMETSATDLHKAFSNFLKRKHGITFKPNRTRIVFDGDCFEIIDRKTKEPIFRAIPIYA